jgi:hypothetical protein
LVFNPTTKQFVGVGIGMNLPALFSSDGISWTKKQQSFSRSYGQVITNGNVYVFTDDRGKNLRENFSKK